MEMVEVTYENPLHTGWTDETARTYKREFRTLHAADRFLNDPKHIHFRVVTVTKDGKQIHPAI